jgi:hypothetical protein
MPLKTKMDLRVPCAEGNFLISWATTSFSRRTIIRGVSNFQFKVKWKTNIFFTSEIALKGISKNGRRKV